MVVELGLPIGVVLMPERRLAAGGLADHVAPTGEPVLVDLEQGGSVALGVAAESRVQDLRELHLREEGLGQLRRLAGRQRTRPVDGGARLAGVSRIEDMF